MRINICFSYCVLALCRNNYIRMRHAVYRANLSEVHPFSPKRVQNNQSPPLYFPIFSLPLFPNRQMDGWMGVAIVILSVCLQLSQAAFPPHRLCNKNGSSIAKNEKYSRINSAPKVQMVGPLCRAEWFWPLRHTQWLANCTRTRLVILCCCFPTPARRELLSVCTNKCLLLVSPISNCLM